MADFVSGTALRIDDHGCLNARSDGYSEALKHAAAEAEKLRAGFKAMAEKVNTSRWGRHVKARCRRCRMKPSLCVCR